MLGARFIGRSFAPPPFELSGPYEPGWSGSTILTQLHCHTTSSDGSFSPAQTVSDYLGRGYGALAITDHNLQTSQPAGIDTAIPANELGVGTSMQHIIALNSTYNSLAGETDPQTIIDNVRADGGEAHIAHPNWIGSSLSAATIAALTDFYGIEIHNGKVMGGASPGVDPVANPGFAVVKWDAILATKRDTWGIAVDDRHQEDAFNTWDMGRVHVFADSTSVADIVAALVAGRFVADVANFGVTPGYPVRGPAAVSLTCSGAQRMEAWGPSGFLDGNDSDTIEYAPTDAGYVRLVAIGDYTEAFGSALGHEWSAYTGSWSVSSGALVLSSDATGRVMVLRRHREGDFEAQVDIRLNAAGATESGALLFNLLNQNYYYGLRIGTSASTPGLHNKLGIFKTTDGASTVTVVGNANYTATAGSYHTVKMRYTASTGRIEAKVWLVGDSEPDWMIDVTDTDWTWGGFGFRANLAARFDNLYIKGFRTYYQPIAVD